MTDAESLTPAMLRVLRQAAARLTVNGPAPHSQAAPVSMSRGEWARLHAYLDAKPLPEPMEGEFKFAADGTRRMHTRDLPYLCSHQWTINEAGLALLARLRDPASPEA